MTLSTETVRVSYSGNGSTTAFPITFIFWDNSDILAVLRSSTGTETTWAEGTNYTLTGGDGTAGTLTALVAPASGTTLVITSDRALTQTNSYPLGGDFPSTVAEETNDKNVRLLQQAQRDIDRSMKFPLTDSTSLSTAVPSSTERAGKYLVFNAQGEIAVSAGTGTDATLRTDLATSSDTTLGDALVAMKRTLSGATARTLHSVYESMPVNVKDFGATGDGTTNDAAAFTAALAVSYDVWVPDGTYALHTAIEVPAATRLRLSNQAVLKRPSAASATTPVVYVIGTRAALEGGIIQTEKASPDGVVCLGHKSNADPRNAVWWSFQNCTVYGLDTSGNIGVNVPSGQATLGSSYANYFGLIQNINIQSADVGLLISEYANAHNVANVQYWDCRTACLELRGAYANHVVNQFMHTGAANGVVSVKISNKTVGSQESTMNTVIGFAAETAGASDQSLTIASAATSNTIIGTSNVAGGWTVSNDSNFVMLSGVVRYGTDASIDTITSNTKSVIKNTRSGTRDCFDESNNSIVALGAGSTLTLKTKVSSGLLIIRNASDGGTALVQVDATTGADQVFDPDNFVTVGADPGAASSQLWVEADGTSTRITNRYAASKQIDVRTVGAN